MVPKLVDRIHLFNASISKSEYAVRIAAPYERPGFGQNASGNETIDGGLVLHHGPKLAVDQAGALRAWHVMASKVLNYERDAEMFRDHAVCEPMPSTMPFAGNRWLEMWMADRV